MEGKKVKVAESLPARCATCAAAPWSSRWASTASLWRAAASRSAGAPTPGQGYRRHVPQVRQGPYAGAQKRKGRIYYGCERYPDCDFMTWDMPVPPSAEKCGSTLFRKGAKLYCAKEGCGFEMPVPKKDYAEEKTMNYKVTIWAPVWRAAKRPSGWRARACRWTCTSRSPSTFRPHTKARALRS